jgi:hypothetical protein
MNRFQTSYAFVSWDIPQSRGSNGIIVSEVFWFTISVDTKETNVADVRFSKRKETEVLWFCVGVYPYLVEHTNPDELVCFDRSSSRLFSSC